SSFQLPDPAILLGLRRGSAFTPKRCLCPFFCFILPSVIQRLSDPVSSTRLRDVSALHSFLYDLPLLFSTSIYAGWPATLHREGGVPLRARQKRFHRKHR